MMASPIQVDDMRSAGSVSRYDEIYREILHPSFRPDELDPPGAVFDVVAPAGRYHVSGLCALDGDAPVGCVLAYPFPVSQVLLIGYVAVKSAYRGRGVGGLLLDAAAQKWFGTADFTLVLAEVEDPRHHPVADDIDPTRRVSFYARRGARVVCGPYFQPKLGGYGKKRVYDIFLTVLSGNGPDDSVRAAQVASFLLEYFRGSGEGRDWPRFDDEEGTQLLDWYRRRDVVALHPIGDYARIDIPRMRR